MLKTQSFTLFRSNFIANNNAQLFSMVCDQWTIQARWSEGEEGEDPTGGTPLMAASQGKAME